MARAIEQKWVFNTPEGTKITRTEVAKDGKSIEVFTIAEVQRKETIIQDFDELFPIVDPSEISPEDKIMEHKPKTDRQKMLKDLILEGIKQGIPAFRVQCMDPSEENGVIVFKAGCRPAVGHSPIWWKENYPKLKPGKNSRIATDLQWAALLAKLMKYLVEEERYSVRKAWEAVCNDSCNLGHYRNSKYANNGEFEPTGSRKVGDFYDLANTCKIIQKAETSEFLLVGGCCKCDSSVFPLADSVTFNEPEKCYDYGVGLFVLDV